MTLRKWAGKMDGFNKMKKNKTQILKFAAYEATQVQNLGEQMNTNRATVQQVLWKSTTDNYTTTLEQKHNKKKRKSVDFFDSGSR